MIFDMVIYVTLINLTEIECILLLLLRAFFFVYVFRVFDFGQIKMTFIRGENFKNCFAANVNV